MHNDANVASKIRRGTLCGTMPEKKLKITLIVDVHASNDLVVTALNSELHPGSDSEPVRRLAARAGFLDIQRQGFQG